MNKLTDIVCTYSVRAGNRTETNTSMSMDRGTDINMSIVNEVERKKEEVENEMISTNVQLNSQS